MLDFLTNDTIGQLLTALLGIGGVSGLVAFIKKGFKWVRMAKEAVDVFIKVVDALEPEEDGTVKVTGEEIKEITKEGNEAIEYWKHIKAMKVSKNNSAKIILLFLLLPALFTGCGSVISFQTDTEIILTDEPQQLAEIIDAAYAGYEAYEVNQGEKINVINLAFDLYPKIKTAINDSKAVLIEAKKLTRPQILSLTNLGDKYEIGIHKEKFKQVIYMALGLVQTYYLFTLPAQAESDTLNVSYRSVDPYFLVDPKIKLIERLD